MRVNPFPWKEIRVQRMFNCAFWCVDIQLLINYYIYYKQPLCFFRQCHNRPASLSTLSLLERCTVAIKQSHKSIKIITRCPTSTAALQFYLPFIIVVHFFHIAFLNIIVVCTNCEGGKYHYIHPYFLSLRQLRVYYSLLFQCWLSNETIKQHYDMAVRAVWRIKTLSVLSSAQLFELQEQPTRKKSDSVFFCICLIHFV